MFGFEESRAIDEGDDIRGTSYLSYCVKFGAIGGFNVGESLLNPDVAA